MIARCWFRGLGECWFRPDGRPDRMHLIPAQRLRAAGLTDEEVWDPRVWRFGCRLHHDRLDVRYALTPIRLKRDDYPRSVVEFAADHGFEFFGEREGWRKVTA